jgi:hypothetical protein
MYEMRVETKLTESTKMKQVLSEGKSEMCSQSENEFYRMLFNVNSDVKWTYMNGINKIMKDVFPENYIVKPENDQLPGVYDLEGLGRSVINKLNTNYTSFCILLKDLNQKCQVNNQLVLWIKNLQNKRKKLKDLSKQLTILNIEFLIRIVQLFTTC